MATKKRTSKKKASKAPSTARSGGKKAARKKTASKKTSSKKASSKKTPKKSLFTINPGLPSETKIWSTVSRWKRRTPKAGKAKASLPPYTAVNPESPFQTKYRLPSAETTALVKAYEQASTPPRSGPYVGAPGEGFASKKGKGKKGKAAKKTARKASSSSASKKPRKAKKTTGKKKHLSKEEFLAKMAEGRAAAKKSGKKASKKASKKKRKATGGRPAEGRFAEKMQAARSAKAAKRAARKGAGKSTKKMSAKKAGKKGSGLGARGSKSGAAARKSSRRRKGWPTVGQHKRTFGIPKFKAMNALGVPPNKPIAKAKVSMLRESAGRGISAKQVFEMARATNQKAWICAGRVRTGCGGGSKMLQGSHQIGVFGIGRR